MWSYLASIILGSFITWCYVTIGNYMSEQHLRKRTSIPVIILVELGTLAVFTVALLTVFKHILV